MGKLQLGTRATATFLRILEFCIAALILGIFSYYLAVLSRRAGNGAIPKWEKAVEGISGVAVVYTAFAVILTCFLGGIAFFSFLGIALDICFIGGFLAIAVLADGGRHSCGRTNNSPIGPGEHLSCQLQRVAFIVAVIGAFLFLISAILEFLMHRAHKRDKRYGPSPSNNYTSGYGKQRFWQRKNRKNRNKGLEPNDAELGTVGAGALAADHHDHHKHDSSLINGTDGYGGAPNKYAEPTVPQHSAGYGAGHTAGPQFTGDESANPNLVGQGRTGYQTGGVTTAEMPTTGYVR
ncbi:hypothetical protein MMC21_004345 [Puttea exsequens]|nr:hypothetical protein [Puttea exsequens]